jgi:hypothetical protein
MQVALKELLAEKLIICSCEGNAEKAIIDLLLENNKLCFNRTSLIDGTCTTIRSAKEIADNFLTRAYSQDIAILRILDKENDHFKIPAVYLKNRNVNIYNVVTKPEIEMLHIISENLTSDFQRAERHNKNLRPSAFFQGYITRHSRKNLQIKSTEYIKNFYSDIDKLINAIKIYHQQANQKHYDFSDLLAKF